MKKHELSDNDLYMVDTFESEVGRYLEAIKRARQFKVGDFLILKISYDDTSPLTVRSDSYGAPIKYQVVYVNEHGVAFVKRINKKGEPFGHLESCVGLELDSYMEDSDTKFVFELDPDYADSLLLQDAYDPASLHRSKKEIWKSVTEHNKACKIPTGSLIEVNTLFGALNIGDTVWSSSVGFYFVQDKKTLTRTEYKKLYPDHIGMHYAWQVKGQKWTTITVLTLRDKNGKVKEVVPHDFWRKALYKERPRSYKELSI